MSIDFFHFGDGEVVELATKYNQMIKERYRNGTNLATMDGYFIALNDANNTHYPGQKILLNITMDEFIRQLDRKTYAKLRLASKYLGGYDRTDNEHFKHAGKLLWLFAATQEIAEQRGRVTLSTLCKEKEAIGIVERFEPLLPRFFAGASRNGIPINADALFAFTRECLQGKRSLDDEQHNPLPPVFDADIRSKDFDSLDNFYKSEHYTLFPKLWGDKAEAEVAYSFRHVACPHEVTICIERATGAGGVLVALGDNKKLKSSLDHHGLCVPDYLFISDRLLIYPIDMKTIIDYKKSMQVSKVNIDKLFAYTARANQSLAYRFFITLFNGFLINGRPYA